MAHEGSKPTETPPETPSGKPLLWMAAGLVAAALGVLVFLLGPPGRSPSESVGPSEVRSPSLPVLEAPPSGAGSVLLPAQGPKPLAPAARLPPPATSALPPLDLFQGESLELLRMGRDVTLRNAPLNSDRLKEVYKYGKEHPGDARPHLLMGADAMNRSWYGFAIDHYARAQKEDPRARQDPRMLQDLVKLAGSEHYATQSGTAIRDIYGPAGISPLEDAITEAESKGDAARVERLTALVRSLSEPPAAH